MRPYATEEAFLAEERETFTRTAVTLIGAPTRPRGVVIRFEVTLSDGKPVLRGEGRVLSFQAADARGPSSLTLRFTRLDARSKALVDRAGDLREGVEATAPAPDAVVPQDVPTSPSSAPSSGAQPSPAPERSADPPEGSVSGVQPPPAAASSCDDIAILSMTMSSLPPPDDVGEPREADPGRDVLLDRLRTRAKTLSPMQVATILTPTRQS